MRDSFDELLRDTWLVSIAFGIALGWSVVQFASGISAFFSILTTEYGSSGDFFGPSLTWTIDGHIIPVGSLLWPTLQLAIVLGIALVVLRRRDRVTEPDA